MAGLILAFTACEIFCFLILFQECFHHRWGYSFSVPNSSIEVINICWGIDFRPSWPGKVLFFVFCFLENKESNSIK